MSLATVSRLQEVISALVQNHVSKSQGARQVPDNLIKAVGSAQNAFWKTALTVCMFSLKHYVFECLWASENNMLVSSQLHNDGEK